jgi:uncharacterized protein YdeI (YjbR/CyaY-like superfamily)
VAKDELPILPFSSRDEWAAWLEVNHASEPDGIWVKFAKKASGLPTITYEEARDTALCYGWIDGLVRSLDETSYLQRFTPRRSRSKWSKINRDIATRLIETGEMKPAGLAEVERAKADGRWDAAYDSPRTMSVPEDLAKALGKNPKAKAAFDALTRAQRYTILYNVHEAKRPETRVRRIDKYVAILAAGEKP